ncbi:MAG: DAK2 domain-containing protein [Clostridia bacterium]|nr:DAK2 domain-containing protein [Clostridia bacterium]
MKTKRIDGTLFESMLREGLNNLYASEREINALNVFPVADGDTGTNMRMTLENGIRCAKSTEKLCDYLKALSSGMLLGARGNSGVILSQLFKGIYLELSRRSVASPMMLRNAFIRGYKAAYESVIKPVEGTILTVSREGIEYVIHNHKTLSDAETLMEEYISAMEASLDRTPDLLPVLAEMGVVDSGAKGYIAIVRGMLNCLTGEKTESSYNYRDHGESKNGISADLSKFDENSDFIEGYCMEFILQLMKKPTYIAAFDAGELLAVLEKHGNSIVLVQDGLRVKVHVHTRKPSPIIDFAQKYGEFLTFKLENMQLQHNEYVDDRARERAEKPQKSEHKPIAVIAVVNGEGFKRIFRELGCDLVIDGSSTMNTSTDEFLSAIRSLDADRIIILPNGPNMMLASQQAVKLSGLDNVVILPAKTPAQGYYALAMDVRDSDDIEKRIAQMQRGIDSVDTLLITPAARDFATKEVKGHENEMIAIADDDILFSSKDAVETVVSGLKKLDGFEDRDTCIFFRGANADASLDERIRERIEEEFPLIETSFEWGGQDVYDWIIGIS